MEEPAEPGCHEMLPEVLVHHCPGTPGAPEKPGQQRCLGNNLTEGGVFCAAGERQSDESLHGASYGPNPICKGCLSCSKDNGCIRCQHKLFFFLRREGMRQYGECLHSCPSGYYGLRAPDMNRCSRCRIENCDSCFSRDFCTKCKAGFYLHRGRCFGECPDGFASLEETMECV
ncbi:hypothetical protein KIL84_010913, partial [Mauremys mutica]